MSKPRKPKGRQLNGILLLNKPKGLSSNQALQRAKWLLAAAKAGHTGSLDPMATGVLPLCFGEATKYSQYLLDADKTYRCTIRFGVSTETGDAEGEVVAHSDASSLTENQVQSALAQFIGEQLQVPSMYSALKHQGQPLYKLARQGIEVERQARPIMVYRLELLAFRPGQNPEADVLAHVSKGTYIRTLAEDIGKALHCGAHINALHRSQAGPFTEDSYVSLEQLEAMRGDGRAELLDSLLLPIESAIDHLQRVKVPESSAFYLRQGQAVLEVSALQSTKVGELVRVHSETGEFLGVAEVQTDGRLAPRKLLQQTG